MPTLLFLTPILPHHSITRPIEFNTIPDPTTFFCLMCPLPYLTSLGFVTVLSVTASTSPAMAFQPRCRRAMIGANLEGRSATPLIAKDGSIGPHGHGAMNTRQRMFKTYEMNVGKTLASPLSCTPHTLRCTLADFTWLPLTILFFTRTKPSKQSPSTRTHYNNSTNGSFEQTPLLSPKAKFRREHHRSSEQERVDHCTRPQRRTSR